MDRLAVELLTQIFFNACTDGGQTGCALSLVSKGIRDTSRPARFHSVALYSSPAKIERFLCAYERERVQAVDIFPRVRHLWLSYDECNEGQPTGMPPPASAMPTSRADYLALLRRRTQSWRSAQEHLDEQYSRVIPSLICTVAPDLHTLVINQARWRTTSVVQCRFPLLQELTLIGGDPNFLPFNAVQDDKPVYPALRRLHHILTPLCKDVNFLNWPRHAPLVTHLRVSRLDFSPRSTVETFEHVISDASTAGAFSRLQCVIVLPHPAPPPTSQSSHASFKQFLEYLHALPQRSRAPMTVLPPLNKRRPHQGVDAPRDCIIHIRELWIERIDGGPGCWADALPERPRSRYC